MQNFSFLTPATSRWSPRLTILWEERAKRQHAAPRAVGPTCPAGAAADPPCRGGPFSHRVPRTPTRCHSAVQARPPPLGANTLLQQALRAPAASRQPSRGALARARTYVRGLHATARNWPRAGPGPAGSQAWRTKSGRHAPGARGPERRRPHRATLATTVGGAVFPPNRPRRRAFGGCYQTPATRTEVLNAM